MHYRGTKPNFYTIFYFNQFAFSVKKKLYLVRNLKYLTFLIYTEEKNKANNEQL